MNLVFTLTSGLFKEPRYRQDRICVRVFYDLGPCFHLEVFSINPERASDFQFLLY